MAKWQVSEHFSCLDFGSKRVQDLTRLSWREHEQTCGPRQAHFGQPGMALTEWKTPVLQSRPGLGVRGGLARIPGNKEKPDIPGGGWQRKTDLDGITGDFFHNGMLVKCS